jgi:Tc toxin complex TcA C-terminal TcB-binding domain
MSDLIILRLHPSSPMAPNDFRNLLTGLTIKAYDLSFADSTNGALLGTASGVASPHLGSTTNNQVTISSTAIMQHYLDVLQLGGTKKRFLESVATAVVLAAPPAGHPEYPVATAYDLRLEITKPDGTRIVDHRLDFNVVTSSMGSPLSKSQKTYFGLGASAYVKLPATGASLDPNVAFVDLPDDGQPPPFADLVHAIDLVLTDDPGAPNSSLIAAAPLTPAQAKHVAAEIVWNRQVYPAPQPDETLGADPFGALYTKPPVDPTITGEAIEKARPTFEAGEDGYYGSRQAELLRMAGLVYSASSAIAEEQLSIAAERARLDVPMITGAATPTTLSTAGVALSRAGGLQPAYVVPAAVFYALAATMPPQVDAQHRFDMARLGLEAKLTSELEVARDAGVIAFPAGPSTQAGPSLTVDQAARRLHALGGTQTELAELPLAAPVDALVGDWLAYAGPTEAIESAFWTGEVAARPDAYLALVLGAVTRNYPPLIAAVTGAPFAVANVTQLVALTDQQWRDLFLGPLPPLGPPPRIALLPPWTQPGTPAQRAEAFIRGLRAFFSVTQVAPGAPPPVIGAPPPLPVSSTDTLSGFAAAYPAHSGGASFSFANPVDRAAITDTAAEVLPGDDAAQSWLTDAVVAVCELWQITDIGAADVRFSLVEALYSRGFTSAAQIAALTAAEFRFALTGTVAYSRAGAIQAKAGGPAASSGGGDARFNPVNPNNNLVDCVPPAQLSPLGPVAYLRQLLDVTPRSTCDQPDDSGAQDTLLVLLGGRRGDLGALHATAANLDTPLPVIDLVNESLEALVGALPGAVHDTAADEVAGHVLGAGGHDPQTFFGAVAEHSSPAWPGAVPAAYDVLRADFSVPTLPYDQPLDVNRSYLGALRTNRFDTLRLFRRDITEFPLDAALEPVDFRRHQWRLPVRLDLALEYLHLSPSEYAHLFTDEQVVTEVPPTVPELLAVTGMGYCEFLDLVASGFLPLQRAHGDGEGEGQDDAAFPACEPCCIDNLRIEYGGVPDVAGVPDDADVLRRLVIFVRLWRSLQTTPCCALSMAVLADVTVVLGLFDGEGHVNPDFPRQLAAFCMLRDLLGLPLRQAGVAPAGTGADRTHLLALWAGPAAGAWAWAVGVLVEGVEDAAERRNHRLRRQPEQAKLLVDNLDRLSILAGFDPATATDTWQARPTGTLRFAEVLLKIYVSEFTVGEVLYLFANAHLDGDDAFPLPTGNEAHDDTLELPDDEGDFGLWALRAKLLAAEVDEDPDRERTWTRIIGVLVDDFGYQPAAADDPLTLLGEHFFPSVLEREGWSVPAARRRFSTALALGDTAPAMWNTPPDGPFRYNAAQETLSTQLPLSDGDMADKFSHLRNLGGPERDAVQAMWFAPRTLLAPFAFLFEDFTTAADHLINAADEDERFGYFAAAVDLFRRRSHLLSEHLAEHVGAAAEQPDGGVGPVETWRLLRTLHGDENAGLTTWEDDSGKPPDLTWPGQPTGGAFAAILGVLGTGLPGRFATAATDPAWVDMTGPFGLFGADRNHWNAPVPTVVPSTSLTLTDAQLRAASVRNGFALRNVDGEPLHGAEPFRVQWKGTLLVEETGTYEFLAGGPTPEGDEPDREHCPDHQWRVTLRRGQKSWQVLERDTPQGEPAPDFHSAPLKLRRGCFELIVTVVHAQPDFADPADVEPRHTGFQLKYAGPDTGGELHTIPHSRLYRHQVDTPLGADLQLAEGPAAYLRARYTSSLRDVRRTYQRAFKSALLVHRFRLTATPLPRDTQSELGQLLDHAQTLAGRSHPRTGAIFGTHHAWFDLDLLPVDDPVRPPAGDERALPTPKRQAALFDLWERLDDYTGLRRDTRSARERPAWRLFYEAVTRQPDDPAELVRHLGIDVGHAAQVLTYSAVPADYSLVSPDLESEAWAIRAWRAEQWLDARERCFHPLRLSAARPHRWAAVDPSATPDAGNDNLTKFVLDGALETGTPCRYDDIRDLDDGLRVRARDALVARLCAEDRVPLPFAPGSFARTARDLGDLLLQDVACGTEQRVSRIEDAISSVQAFVQRARLGLEPGFAVGPAFAEVWDGRFATFWQWERCVRRELHRENWIGWEELRRARRVEAFRFLEDRLRRRQLTVAVPGSLEWWSGHRPPAHPRLTLLQESEWSQLAMLSPGLVPEGLDLLGTPDHDARPSWLAPFDRSGTRDGGGDDGGGDGAVEFVPIDEIPAAVGVADVGHIAVAAAAVHEEGEPAPTDPAELARLPLWLQAAVRLGHRYVRVAAAGVPPASAGFRPCAEEAECCCVCGEHHEPLVDEYYFWLHDDEQYADLVQNADVGSSGQDETSDWHRPEELPALLHHDTVPTVHLYWTRVRRGEFDPPRRTSEAIVIDPSALAAGTLPQLDFIGRLGDSLRFSVTGGVAPVGYADPAPPGFRYDLATDEAITLPQVTVAPAPAAGSFVGDLDAYPYFAYVCPGAPVEPLSPYAVADSVAVAFRADCQYEAALRWYELVVSPFAADNAWTQCDRLPTDGGEGNGGAGGGDGDDVIVLRARFADGRTRDVTCCPTIAADDDVARARAVLLHYLETILDWADALISRNSPEAFRRADVLVDAVARVLGTHPPTVYAETDDAAAPTLAGFVASPAGLNPRLLALYDRVDDRAMLIHTVHNGRRRRSGRPVVDMPYFGDAVPGHCGCGCDADCAMGCEPYRFQVLIERAAALAADARSLGAELLSAYEKGDAELLADLRATQERQLVDLSLVVRDSQLRDADWQVQALEKAKEGAQSRLRYYQNLIAAGLISGESGYQTLTTISTGSRTAGNVSEAIAQAVGVTPDFWSGVAGIAGTPLAFMQMPMGVKLASGFATAARILNALAEIASTEAGRSLTEAGWDRREQDWRQQVDVITIEIEQIERQILGAERRRHQARHELDNTRAQAENAAAVQDYLRDKFTSHELYLFLQRETAALYAQGYSLAKEAAEQAERAFNFELGHLRRSFLPEDGWDSLHEGLLAGDRLVQSLRRLEKAYRDHNCREYELVKHVSLRQAFPLQLLQLQATGATEIELPEWLFDSDYPGQYLRRIKSVSLSVPCVVGPYTGVHCRLTLLSSSTRIDPALGTDPVVCCDDAGTPDGCGCETHRGAYDARPGDPRIVHTYAATQAIATSTGQNDAGLFELSFRDERYLPFEFAGAVSRWRLELPPETNAFDLDTVSDVVMHLSYTAREGGEVLADAAAGSARHRLPGDGLRLVDLRRDLPDVWRSLETWRDGHGDYRRSFDLAITEALFPYVPMRRVSSVTSVQLLIEAPCAEPGSSHVVRFFPHGHHHDERHWRHGSGRHEECSCDRIDVVCVAGQDYEGLFRGEIDLSEVGPLGPIPDGTRHASSSGEDTSFGCVELPDDLGEICDAYVVLTYCADRTRGCVSDTPCPCATCSCSSRCASCSGAGHCGGGCHVRA